MEISSTDSGMKKLRFAGANERRDKIWFIEKREDISLREHPADRFQHFFAASLA